MAKILVIAGTADAVDFLQTVPKEHEIIATTFSKFGEMCIAPQENIKIISGALDKEGFGKLIEKEAVTALVDMSHPFAVEVSKNVFEVSGDLSIPYYRYERDTLADMEHCIRCADFPAAVEALKNCPGNILLTIGSRNLHYFLDLPNFFDRCYVRVLASSRIMQQLEDMAIDPAHIFAMKGVASKELNIALAKEVNAKAIVTKDSGFKGGIWEKYAAAEELNIPLFVIDKPAPLGKIYTDFDQILAEIGRD